MRHVFPVLILSEYGNGVDEQKNTALTKSMIHAVVPFGEDKDTPMWASRSLSRFRWKLATEKRPPAFKTPPIGLELLNALSDAPEPRSL